MTFWHFQRLRGEAFEPWLAGKIEGRNCMKVWLASLYGLDWKISIKWRPLMSRVSLYKQMIGKKASFSSLEHQRYKIRAISHSMVPKSYFFWYSIISSRLTQWCAPLFLKALKSSFQNAFLLNFRLDAILYEVLFACI